MKVRTILICSALMIQVSASAQAQVVTSPFLETDFGDNGCQTPPNVTWKYMCSPDVWLCNGQNTYYPIPGQLCIQTIRTCCVGTTASKVDPILAPL